jgi:hypothetical protein
VKSAAALVASMLAAAVAGAAPSVEPLPRWLSETGYGALEMQSFTPRYPLWSDGAAKRRWILLPAGTSIDSSKTDAWDFPPGTKLWKEFAFDGPIETRLIERLADGSWRFATYIWLADGRDAELAHEAGLRMYPVSGAPDGRYAILSRNDCRACHEGPAVPVLGYSAVQLEAPPLPSALGYLHANCGHCHNATGAVAGVDLVLAQSAADPQASAQATRTSLFGRASRFRSRDGDAARRDHVIVERMHSTNPYTRMPPIGVQVVDREGAALVEAWIRQTSEEASR